ncbi:MAG TPA: GerMN domain-containing protein, partial [Anaerolineae bacterium]|nr:GerMN domain-containing protein [Anaerolineae bacterium]
MERAAGVGVSGLDAEGALAALLAGPTSRERARGLWSAIPEGTVLRGVQVQPDRTAVVRLAVPLESLRALDHGTFEIMVEQIGWTLEPLGWRDLRIQAWDFSAGTYVSLAAFLPEIPAPRKEAMPSDEQSVPLAVVPPSAAYVGQPPAPGQAQPQGGLSGKTVYVSAGHGWQWNGYAWRTQRPPYPGAPYSGPIIEDHNNAEAVDQYLLQYLWNAGADVWPVRERDLNGIERIVNNDGGTGYAEQGAWSTGTSSGYDLNVPGQTYRYATTVTGTATAA